MERISSLQNPKIKHIVRLQKVSERKKYGAFVVEGRRETEQALNAGYEVMQFFFCAAVVAKEKEDDLLHRLKPLAEGFELSQDAFAKVAYRESTGGIVCIMRQQGIGLDRLNPGQNPLLLLLESVEKPGNLGAMLRTADAAGIDGVIVCDPLTDIYNPNLIRSSLGCVFTVPVSVCSSQEALDFLKNRDIAVYAAVLQTENSCYEADFSGPTAFAMGSEANGLTEFWRRNSVAEIKIPMRGKTDSLNVSTAAAVLLFESVRQRSLRGR